MTYKTIIPIVLRMFPDLPETSPEDLKEELEFCTVQTIDDLLPYCFLEARMGDYMRALIPKNEDKHRIEKLFDFFEQMATCQDQNVRDLLKVGFLEQLWASADLLNTAYKYMHPYTKVRCDELSPWFKDPRKK